MVSQARRSTRMVATTSFSPWWDTSVTMAAPAGSAVRAAAATHTTTERRRRGQRHRDAHHASPGADRLLEVHRHPPQDQHEHDHRHGLDTELGERQVRAALDDEEQGRAVSGQPGQDHGLHPAAHGEAQECGRAGQYGDGALQGASQILGAAAVRQGRSTPRTVS